MWSSIKSPMFTLMRSIVAQGLQTQTPLSDLWLRSSIVNVNAPPHSISISNGSIDKQAYLAPTNTSCTTAITNNTTIFHNATASTASTIVTSKKLISDDDMPNNAVSRRIASSSSAIINKEEEEEDDWGPYYRMCYRNSNPSLTTAQRRAWCKTSRLGCVQCKEPICKECWDKGYNNHPK